jgi:long-chain acyl-CoA synthetase
VRGSAALSEGPRRVSSVAGFLAADADGARIALPTSGTSGAPRWIVRTTASWTSSFAPVSALTGLTSSSRVWVPGPLSATMNLFAAVHTACVSARLVDEAGSATHAHLTPSSLARALEERVPLEGLTVVVAGDRLSPALHARAVAAGARVHHYYGAAELSFVAWGPHAEDLRAFPGVEVAVPDGEVWARSPYLCDGYDGLPGPLRRTPDGFATVGDTGELRDGRLTVSGRPGAVTVGGSTVSLAEVEATLASRAEGEVSVVGLPHDTWGTLLAVVLTVPSDHPGLIAVARDQLTGAARPRLWFHLDRLPQTAAGKVDRQALVSLLSGDGGRARRLV